MVHQRGTAWNWGRIVDNGPMPEVPRRCPISSSKEDVMVTDPRFDVQPDEYTETQKRRSKWTSCLIGCLVVAGVAMVVMIVVAVWVYKNARGWVADGSAQMLDQVIQSSDLPPQEKVEVKAQVDRVTGGFRN